MAKRDVVGEIESVKERNDTNNYRFESSNRLIELSVAFKNHYAMPYELKKYLPIGLTACIEGFIRGVIKEVSDFDELYLKRAFKDNRIDISVEYLMAIQSKKVTAGDIISHTTSISSLDTIEKALSVILDCKIISEISKVKSERFIDDKYVKINLIDDIGNIIATIKEIFELRHIFAHETNAKINLTDDFMNNSVSQCSNFFGAISLYVDSILYPDYPKDQAEMNSTAWEKLKEVEGKYTKNVSEIRSYISEVFIEDEEYIKKFDNSNEAWKTYVESDADFQADMTAKGGTMRPGVYASEKTSHYQHRIERLEWLKDQAERFKEPQ